MTSADRREVMLSVVGVLEVGGWDVAAVLVEASVVEPVDPLGGGDLDVVDALPRPSRLDQFGLVETVDRLCKGIVERVADRPHRGGDAGLGQPLAVAQRRVLGSSVAVGHHRVKRACIDRAGALAGPDGLLEGVQDELGGHRGAAPPAQDPAGVGVGHERHVHPSGPGAHVGHVHHPQPVRRGRREPAPDQVLGAVPGRVGDRGLLDLPADRAGQAQLAHQPLHGAPRHIVDSVLLQPGQGAGGELAVQGQPHLAGAVDGEVLPVHSGDLHLQHLVPLLARGGRAADVSVVRRWGDLQAVLGEHGTDRLDTPAQTTLSWGLAAVCVLADELHDQWAGRSSSAAKKADAAFKIAFRALQLGVLPLQPALDLDRLLGRGPGPLTGVDLGPSHPLPDRLRRRHPEQLRNPLHRRPLRPMLRADLTDHPHRPLPKLPRVLPPTITHDPILLKDWSLRTRRGGSVREPQPGCLEEGRPESEGERDPRAVSVGQ